MSEHSAPTRIGPLPMRDNAKITNHIFHAIKKYFETPIDSKASLEIELRIGKQISYQGHGDMNRWRFVPGVSKSVFTNFKERIASCWLHVGTSLQTDTVYENGIRSSYDHVSQCSKGYTNKRKLAIIDAQSSTSKFDVRFSICEEKEVSNFVSENCGNMMRRKKVRHSYKKEKWILDLTETTAIKQDGSASFIYEIEIELDKVHVTPPKAENSQNILLSNGLLESISHEVFQEAVNILMNLSDLPAK